MKFLDNCFEGLCFIFTIGLGCISMCFGISLIKYVWKEIDPLNNE